uniref:phosducin-like protein 3 n=1 Tax=Oncorhynchus gorbuscha TaxID=8017 RepID=UPI001EAF00CB|nr:phosducin-like protein 3 [Oncorhynchus gorbuscha]
MQQANDNQARRDRSCFESLTLWDLKSHNHIKDREEDVEYQERSESEEGDEGEEEEYVCVIIEGSEVEEDEEEEEEEEEYEVTCVGSMWRKRMFVRGCGGLLEVVEEEEEEECLLEVVVKEEDEEERVESHLATKFPECKFLMILAGQCVPNYPVSHLPTLFIYDSGCIINSLIGEKACGGRNVLEDELKWMLAQSGAFVIDSYEALYQESTPITTPRSEQEQEDDSDDQSDHYDNQGAEV